MCSSRAVQRANSQLSPRSRAVGSFIPPGSSRHFRSSGASSSGRLLQPVRAPPARHAAAPVPPARSPAQPQPPPLPAAAARSPAPRRSDAPGAAPHRGGQERRERARRPRPTQRLRRPRIGRRGAEGAGRCGPPEPCPPEVGERGWPCRRAEASGSGARREGSRAGCDLRAGPRRTCAGSGADGERGAVGARRFCAVGALGSAAPVSPVERHRVRAWRLAPLLSRPPGDERSEVVRRMGVVVITASARVAFVASTRVLRLCVLWERLQSLQGPKLQVVQRLLLFRFDYRLWQLKNQRCEVKHKENISVSIGVFFLEKKKYIYVYISAQKWQNHSPVVSALKKDFVRNTYCKWTSLWIQGYALLVHPLFLCVLMCWALLRWIFSSICLDCSWWPNELPAHGRHCVAAARLSALCGWKDHRPAASHPF